MSNTTESHPIELDCIPVTTPADTVIHAVLDNQPLILVGTALTNYTAVLCPKGWRKLQQWKLSRLLVVRGSLYATGKGPSGRFAVGRFLLNARSNHIVRYRNGNPFDVRLTNLITIPHGLVRQAKIEATRGPDYRPPDVVLPDGRRHAARGPMAPSAQQRIAALLGHDDMNATPRTP